MTKDDKKIVRNVILFCILFSVFFTVYRVSSLLEKKYEDANQQDNNTAVSADKSIEKAMLFGFKFTFCDLSSRELAIHPDEIACYNQIVLSNSK